MPVPAPGQRRRQWAPKVRTGCLTCKKRKKRCGEERPVCMRCLHGRYVCDGYELTPPPTTTTKTTAATTTTKITIKAIDQQSLASYDKDTHGGHDLELDFFQSAAASPSEHFVSIAGIRNNSSDSLFALEPASRTILANGHLNAVLSTSDHKYTQFFVVKVAPTLATTDQWQTFWEMTVPCLSTHQPSIYYAMIALSAAYDSKALGDRCVAVTAQKVNLAIHAFLSDSQSLGPSDSLVLCRLLASISQCTGDWKTAMIHLQHGWKIMIENARNGQLDTGLVRLLAPTFLCASNESARQMYPVAVHASSAHLRIVDQLETIRSEFVASLSSLDWKHVEGVKKTFVLLCWCIMTRANCSLLCSDTFVGPIHQRGAISADNLKESLREVEALLSLPELEETSRSVFADLEVYLRSSYHDDARWADIKHRLHQTVENFLVQAAEVQPNLRIDTYWYEEQEMVCEVDELLQGHSHEPGRLAVAESSSGDLTIDARQQARAHYREFVCRYRSGLMPAFVN